MLTQREIDNLLNMLKNLETKGLFVFPNQGTSKKIDISSLDGKNKFIIDINRKGKIKASKCTYQKRYRKDIILLRLDIDGPPHTNPDGNVLGPNHLHICREGFDDSWAYPLPSEITNETDLIEVLIGFLQYCKVQNINEISIQDVMLQ